MKTKTLGSIIAFLCCFGMYAQETMVREADLPAEAKAFLKEHFTSPFHHAIKEIGQRSISYEVVLDDKTEIEFTEAGRWVEVDGKGKAIPTAFIQKQILDYIKITYPKEAIVKFERDASGYEAGIKSGADLKFDARGTFVKID